MFDLLRFLLTEVGRIAMGVLDLALAETPHLIFPDEGNTETLFNIFPGLIPGAIRNPGRVRANVCYKAGGAFLAKLQPFIQAGLMWFYVR